MTRRWVSLVLTVLIALGSSGCLRGVTVNPEDIDEDSEFIGHVKVKDKKGVEYNAQSLMDSEDGESFLLQRVEIVDDGVVHSEQEYFLPKNEVESIHVYKNSKWVMVSLVGLTSLFMVFLYYKINTDVFD